MASIRFTDVQARPSAFLDVTSLTLDAFQQLVPLFETAFQAHLAALCLDGKPRIGRRFTVYQNCPLPTPEDRLFFILVYPQDLCSRWCTGACSAWAKAKPISGFTSSCHTAGSAPHPRRCPGPFPHGPGPAVRRGGGRRAHGSHAAAGGTGVPPFASDRTERRIVRPQDPAEQKACYSGKKKDHTVKNARIGKSKALLRGGCGCSGASRRPPRCAGGRGGRLSGVPWAERAHAQRCATTAPARTWLTSPRESWWPEATPSPSAWRERAGARGGGSAARLRWRRSLRMTSPCVMTAMSRNTPRWHHGQVASSRPKTRPKSRAHV
jgi:hypothetical protein